MDKNEFTDKPHFVEKKVEQKWGSGVVEQLSLDLRAAYPDIKGFSSRNLWYMKQWYLFYMGNPSLTGKLHQLGAEIASPNRVTAIIDNGGMLPVFGVVPWKRQLLIGQIRTHLCR